ncbi:PIH1 domain-containing protein 1-like [Symsagittifera roscoffensis]|uniref:PIH1 domain-containing protein 1-like n=1 Tax=Symsagittifera roscoffensis TaxID=84072 RepID=UPI00307B7399
MSDSSLLEIDRNMSEENSDLYESILQNFQSNTTNGTQAQPDMYSKKVLPKAGCCMKCKTKKNEKVFVNLCISELLPDPPNVEEDELVQILSNEDAPDFRMPMSIGEPHTELDNAGKGCTVIDVVVSEDFFNRLQDSSKPVLNSFFCTAMLEGIQEKYKFELENEVKILKHKKAMGTIQEQMIRTRRLIREMGDSIMKNIPDIQNLVSSPEVPKYTFVKEPPVGPVEFLVGEIVLPKCAGVKQILLDVGGDRVVLDCRPFYFMDVFFPYEFEVNDVGAQFNADKKILSITIPVKIE